MLVGKIGKVDTSVVDMVMEVVRLEKIIKSRMEKITQSIINLLCGCRFNLKLFNFINLVLTR